MDPKLEKYLIGATTIKRNLSVVDSDDGTSQDEAIEKLISEVNS